MVSRQEATSQGGDGKLPGTLMQLTHLAKLGQVERGAEGRHDKLRTRRGPVQEVVQSGLAAHPAAGAARKPVYAQPPAALPAQDPGNHLQGTQRPSASPHL